VDEVFEAYRQEAVCARAAVLDGCGADHACVSRLAPVAARGSTAARQTANLPVSLASLYDKVNHTEPAILRALVRGSAERLAPVMAALGACASLPGWRVRVLDGNHLPASEKRLLPLRGYRGAALPGQSLVVYDGDSGLVVDMVAHEDAHASERAAVAPLLGSARPGELWIADRHFCTGTVLEGWASARAGFIVREHARHPRLVGQGEWGKCGRAATGLVREQAVQVKGQAAPWRRIELALDTPTEDGETTIRLWSNLPGEVDALRIAELYRTRWRIAGLFGRLESVLHSELRSLGHPRAALLGFATALLAHNVLAVIQRCVEQAHHQSPEPATDVSIYHLAQHVRSGYEGLLIAMPPDHWPSWQQTDPVQMASRLLALARRINPRQVATSKRKPKLKTPKGYVDGATARAHVATARLLAQAKTRP
jgi:IS4 transposase